jgi:hypothetical protein
MPRSWPPFSRPGQEAAKDLAATSAITSALQWTRAVKQALAA